MKRRRIVWLCAVVGGCALVAASGPANAAAPPAAPGGTRLFAIPADAPEAIVELDPVTGDELARWFVGTTGDGTAESLPAIAYDGINLFYLPAGMTDNLVRVDVITGQVRATTPIPMGAGLYDAVAALDGLVFIHPVADPSVKVFALGGEPRAPLVPDIPLPEALVGQAVRGLGAVGPSPMLFASIDGADSIFQMDGLDQGRPGRPARVLPSPISAPGAVAAVGQRIYVGSDTEASIVVVDLDGVELGRLETRYPVISMAAAIQPFVRLTLVPETDSFVPLDPETGTAGVGYSVWAEIVNPSPAALGLAAFVMNIEAGDGGPSIALHDPDTRFSSEILSESWDLLRDPGRADHAPGPADPGQSTPGDTDNDGDRDVFDLLDIEACFTGPDPFLPPGCEGADFDGNGRVDVDDVALFLGNYTGSRGVGTQVLRGVGASQFLFADPRIPEPQTPETIVATGLGMGQRVLLFRGRITLTREGAVAVNLTDARLSVLAEFSAAREAWIVQELPVRFEGGFVVTGGTLLVQDDLDEPGGFVQVWSVRGPGEALIVPDPDISANAFLRLTAGPGEFIAAERSLAAAARAITIRFRYHFLTERGETRLFLNGVNVARLHPPPSGRPGAADSLDRLPDPARRPDNVGNANTLRFGVFQRTFVLGPLGVDGSGGIQLEIVFVSPPGETGPKPKPDDVRKDPPIPIPDDVAPDPPDTPDPPGQPDAPIPSDSPDSDGPGVAAAVGDDGIEIDDLSVSEPEDCAFIPPGDFDGDGVTTADDFEPLDAFYGRQLTANPDAGATCTGLCCLDQLTGDGYVDSGDYSALDVALDLVLPGIAAATGDGGLEAAEVFGDALSNGSLLVLGKDGLFSDHLYELDRSGACVQTFDGQRDRAYTRIRQGPDRRLYVVNLSGSIERFGNVDGELVGERLAFAARYVGPDGADVFVRSPRDVAFDAAGNLYVYPVEIGRSGLVPDLAAAKFRIDEQADPPSLILETLYRDPSRMTHPREIAVDANGNVYVTNSQADQHGDWIVVFSGDGGDPIATLDLQDLISQLNVDDEVRAPIGLEVSERRSVVYLASALGATLYRFAVDSSNGVEFLPGSELLTVDVPGMDFISDITENGQTGEVWITGFRRTETSLEPALARWSGQSEEAPEPVAIASLTCTELARPISLAVVLGPGPGDFDDDGDVDLADLLVLQSCFAGPDAAPPPNCTAADLDGDGDVDLADVVTFQSLFTGSR